MICEPGWDSGGSWFLEVNEVVESPLGTFFTKGKFRVVNQAYWHILQGLADIEVVDL